jgi:hypothetical protein
MNRIKTIVRAAGIAGAGGESSAGKSLPAINPDPMMKMKTIMILLFAAGIGSPARAGNKTDASLFMKSDSSVYQPEDFAEPRDDGSSILLVSKPTAKISTKIISACAREPELNTMDKFVRYIDSHKMLPSRANIPGNPQSRKRPESLRVAIAEMVGKLDSTQERRFILILLPSRVSFGMICYVSLPPRKGSTTDSHSGRRKDHDDQVTDTERATDESNQDHH